MKEKEKRSITEIYQKQISMSEWFENINFKDKVKYRDEDNKKRDVLEKISEIIGLPFDRPTKMRASDIKDNTKIFRDFIQTRGDELCALRLIPDDSSLPKYRMRGHSVKDVVSKWFPEQKIDYEKYAADFIPHSATNNWSAIFVISDFSIVGEIIADGAFSLTQGFYHENKPHFFRYDFKEISMMPSDKEAISILKKMLDYLHITEIDKQTKLFDVAGCEFSHNYIKGYFEVVVTELGVWFVDYNKILGENYSDFELINEKNQKKKKYF
ncbi:MAG: hypothetical protein ACP5N2_07335 [Candidatus Nanoarchaeia archaeon]